MNFQLEGICKLEWHCWLRGNEVMKNHNEMPYRNSTELTDFNTVSHKPPIHAVFFVATYRQTWTNFEHSFTLALRDKLRKKMQQNLPPNLKSVAALPCEISYAFVLVKSSNDFCGIQYHYIVKYEVST